MKIYQVKGRPRDNPLIVHVADHESIIELADGLTGAALTLAEAFWPGPLTMVMKKKDSAPIWSDPMHTTVAVRIPSHQVALDLIKISGRMIAAPSANLSGRPSPTRAGHVLDDLGGCIDYILDGGCSGGLESTVLDMTQYPPVILRPGYVTQSMISQTLEGAAIDYVQPCNGATPISPGTKYTHYAPRAPMTVVCGSYTAMSGWMIARMKEATSSRDNIRTGFLVNDRISEEISQIYDDTVFHQRTVDALPTLTAGSSMIITMGPQGDHAMYGNRFYAALRMLDDWGADRIYCEGTWREGVGAALMNRMEKACGGDIVVL
jgi:L-threonylcarbamoyladenylate synthase